MTHNDLIDTPEESSGIADAPQEISSPSGEGMGLTWRLVIAVVALAILAVLAYPYVPGRGTASPAAVSSGDQLSALSAPRATAQANPDSPAAQFELGNAYVRAGQWEDAAAAYKKAIELDPNYQTAYANLGVVYYQQGKFDLAAAQYEKALELDPADNEVAYNLGALYLQQALSAGGQPDQEMLNKAIVQLENVKQRAPDLAEPYFSLGVAYFFLNQKQAAVDAFEAFLARDSGQDPRASQEAQRYLQSLRGE